MRDDYEEKSGFNPVYLGIIGAFLIAGIVVVLMQFHASDQLAIKAGNAPGGERTVAITAAALPDARGVVVVLEESLGSQFIGVLHPDSARSLTPHFDSLAGEDPGLLEDYLGPETIAFIEWPGTAAPVIDPEKIAMRVRLEHLGRDRRRLTAR